MQQTSGQCRIFAMLIAFLLTGRAHPRNTGFTGLRKYGRQAHVLVRDALRFSFLPKVSMRAPLRSTPRIRLAIRHSDFLSIFSPPLRKNNTRRPDFRIYVRKSMKPHRTLAETRTPDGSRLTLHEHDGDISLRLDGRQVMSSTATASERQLAEVACAFHPPLPNPRVLVGGLGLGFTLRRVLELVGPKATVHVAECIADVVAWNRKLLGPENQAMLKDPRVSVFVSDVFNVIKKSTAGKDRYDAILLDVDNGPVAMVKTGNQRLYSGRGIATIVRALNPGGRMAVWSADEDKPFFERIKREGLRVESFDAKSHERAKRAAHRIYSRENSLKPGSQTAPYF